MIWNQESKCCYKSFYAVRNYCFEFCILAFDSNIVHVRHLYYFFYLFCINLSMYKLLFSLCRKNFFLLDQTTDRHKAQLAYEWALKDGYVTVNRSRILLIGQDRAGKTSLKKSLLGLPFDSEEQSTEGIEVDPSKCKIDVDQAASNWQSIGENKPGLLECSEDVAKIMIEKIFIPDYSVRKHYIPLKDFDEEDKDESSDEDFEKDSAYISPADFEEGSFDGYKYGRKKVCKNSKNLLHKHA